MRKPATTRSSSWTASLLTSGLIGVLYFAVGLFAQQQDDGKDSLETQISATLTDVGQHRVKQGEAWNVLMELPQDEALSAVLNIIARNDASVTNSTARRFAYEALVKWNAAQTSRGFSMMLNGIADTGTAVVAARGLLDAPESLRRDSIKAIKTFVSNASISWQDRSNFIRRSLPDYAETARACESELMEVLLDKTEHDHVRWAAASAMIKTLGPGRVIAKQDQLDAIGQKVVCWELIRFLGRNKDAFNFDSEAFPQERKESIRRFVINALNHEDLSLRKDAFQGLTYFYGVESVSKNADGVYEWHPQLLGLLTKMAEADPDDQLRQGAQAFIEAADSFGRRMEQYRLDWEKRQKE